MIIYELACEGGHRFEGWFGSAEDFTRQQEAGLVSCPVCEDVHVRKVPTARVHVGKSGSGSRSRGAGEQARAEAARAHGEAEGARAEVERARSEAERARGAAGGHAGAGGASGSASRESGSGAGAGEMPAAMGLPAEALRLLREMVRNTENVGTRFAEEARKIHYEEVPARPIRGQATPDEAAALQDEGIEFSPLPPILTEDVQ